MPYKIAVLAYLFDEEGRVLLLHRKNPPNQDLYSPIGGKLHMDDGESPAACAIREIKEEAGIDVDLEDLHLTGIVSEAGFERQMHWLMFLYEVTRPVRLPLKPFPSWTEVLEVIRKLGYRKTCASELQLDNTEDWTEEAGNTAFPDKQSAA